MIKLQAIGNLGKDCVTNTVNGKNVINFSVAHTQSFGEKKTIWVECAYWTERTGIVPYLKKGQKVYVDGTPELRQYTTSDGKPGASLMLRVSSIELLGKGENDLAGGNTGGGGYQQNYSAGQPTSAQPTQDMGNPPAFEDDLPF